MQTLHLGDDLQVFAAPAAHSDFPCGTGPQVTVDGVPAVLSTSPSPGQQEQVCVPDWRGVRVLVILTVSANTSMPDPTGPHGVLAYARDLHPLGPDPAQWTTDPLR